LFKDDLQKNNFKLRSLPTDIQSRLGGWDFNSLPISTFEECYNGDAKPLR